MTGTCRETVVITIDGLTLDGQGTTTVDGGGGGQAVITVDGARRVGIKNLTVSNGPVDGILVQRAATVDLQGVTAQNNMQDGLSLDDGSSVNLQNASLTSNGRNDLFASFGSRLTLTGNNNIPTCSLDTTVLFRILGSLPSCLG